MTVPRRTPCLRAGIFPATFERENCIFGRASLFSAPLLSYNRLQKGGAEMDFISYLPAIILLILGFGLVVLGVAASTVPRKTR